jgi:hypothetical protein
MQGDEKTLLLIRAHLEGICSHASVRRDGDAAFLLAIGKRGIHSVDLRRRDGTLCIEYWLGVPEDEAFIGTEQAANFQHAEELCAAWLRRDAG